MRAHPLPGINKKIDAHKKEVAAEGLAGSSAFQYNGDPSKGILSKEATRTIEHLKKGGALDTMDDTASAGPPVHGGGGQPHFLEKTKQGPVTLKAKFSDEFGNIKGTSAYGAIDVEKSSPVRGGIKHFTTRNITDIKTRPGGGGDADVETRG